MGVFQHPNSAGDFFGRRNMAARFFASSCSSAKPKSESLPSQPECDEGTTPNVHVLPHGIYWGTPRDSWGLKIITHKYPQAIGLIYRAYILYTHKL